MTNNSTINIDNILDNLADGITIQDTEGKLLYVNKSALKSCGVSTEDEMVNKDLVTLYKQTLSKFIILDENGNRFDLDELPGRRALRGEKNPHKIIKYYNKVSGESHWAHIKSQTVLDDNGRVIQAINIISDITELKHFEEVLKFKAEASKVLSSTLNYLKALEIIAKLSVPYMADWCFVDIVENGQLKNLVVANKDPDKISKAKKMIAQNPKDVHSSSNIAKVIRTGKPIYITNINDKTYDKVAADAHYVNLLTDENIYSVIITPLKVQGKIIGTMMFLTVGPHRIFSENDFQLAKLTTERASLAIEKSILYYDVVNERRRLDKLLSEVPGVVWELWVNPDGDKQRVNYVSKYLEKMLGYQVHEWLNDPGFWLQIIHPEDRDRISNEISEIFNSGNSGIIRYRWIKKNREIVWVESQFNVIKNTQSKPVGIRAVTMDISESIEMEKRKDDFISMASHELKTPLTSIKLYLTALEKNLSGTSRVNAGNYIDKVDKQINRLQRLVTELLNVSNIQAGKLELQKSRFSLEELIKENIEDMQKLSNRHKIKLKGNFDGTVYADKGRIEQVLTNMISNAIKFSPDDEEIAVTLKPNGKHVIVGVEDNGIGINKKYHNKIFDRFYRVYEDKEKTYPGMGMGLYISKQIIDRHKGKIWLDTQREKGSTFYFSLPYESY